MFSDEYFMQQALALAQIAFEENEIPVGAVVVYENQIIGKGYNQTIKTNDPTAHAEMLAITAASNFIGSRYLNQCTLYVTLEPCPMCAGACFWAMFKEIVFGANDLKNGFSKLALSEKKIFHPKTKIKQGILAEECKKLMQDFFKKLRN
ncbi:MAG: nucleoside deaminase [Bacteroidetes bacterium]|nr:MAG: nucleoside deaminase [Bacteroidota bacterium]